MNAPLRILFGTLVLVGLVVLGLQQHKVIKNQHAQMRQQFHSDQIALMSFFGNDGIVALRSTSIPEKVSPKNAYATGLLLQRLIVANRIRQSFSDEQWQMLQKDARATMKSPLLRTQWQKIRLWYTEDERSFVDHFIN